MKYCKESLIILLFGAFVLSTGCSSFGKGSCDRCPEFTQSDTKTDQSEPQITQKDDAE